MADIADSTQKINDIEVSADAPITEDLLLKMGGAINYLLDKGSKLNAQLLTSGSSFVVSPNLLGDLLVVIGWGGGGGGESSPGSGSDYVGSGGLGAPISTKIMTTTPSATISYSVGSGGPSNTDGSSSTFGSLTFYGGMSKALRRATNAGSGNGGGNSYGLGASAIGGAGAGNSAAANTGGGGGGAVTVGAGPGFSGGSGGSGGFIVIWIESVNA